MGLGAVTDYAARHRGGRLAARSNRATLPIAWRVVSVALVVTLLASLGPNPDRASAQGAPTSSYIVRSGDTSQLGRQVRLHRGQIRKQLVQGAVVDLTAADARSLAEAPGVYVSPDIPVVLSTLAGSTHPATTAFTTATGADRLVAAGIDGRGATVAVLDTGIDPSPDFGNRLVGGVDLTGEGNPFRDDYGHGTFVAGLIASDGTSSHGRYKGEAPGADLVAIKVARADGAVDTATVIEGIEWAVANQARYGIGVLNLSLGADASESTTTAPLDAAVERAWQAGIVVVASAGNYGPDAGSVSKPGDDPLILTAGALDDAGTPNRADDTVPSFSGVGPTWADGWFKPDLVVSGRSVVSVRAPRSTVDRQNPSARVGNGYFKGSGTSFSSAIMSGAAALVLDADESARPDDVKGRLLATAARGPVGNPFVDGHGALDVSLAATVKGVSFNQDRAVDAGMSSPAPAGHGRVDLGGSWAASTWNPAAWAGSSWWGSQANQLGAGPSVQTGSSWQGSGRGHARSIWSGSSWSGSSWSGSSWSGSSWSGSEWNRYQWS